MNIILFGKDDRIGGSDTVRIYGRRFEHIIKVIKPETGDRLRCGEFGGCVGEGVVKELSSEYLDMETILTADPPPKADITLILALPRPKYLRRILQSVTSLGVKKIFLMNSERVEKSYWDSPVLDEDNLKHQLILGLEQSGDTVLPGICLKRYFKPFIEDELPLMIKGTSPILAHPGSDTLCPSGCSGPVTLVMGPEGGFIAYEVDKMIRSGFMAVSLGARILNIETSVPAFIYKMMPGPNIDELMSSEDV